MERTFDPRGHGLLGLGCWAIGGPTQGGDGGPVGWGQVDDDESSAAIERGLQLGIRVFDTADAYGTGHSERVLGRALRDRRDECLIVTKFGNAFDEGTRRLAGRAIAPDDIRRACEASLERLGTDRIDVYLFHMSGYDPVAALEVRDRLERLVDDGLIRGYGWSTDDPARAEVFATEAHCVALEVQLNVIRDAPAMVELLERRSLPAFIRSPLAMGLLGGRIERTTRLSADDVRGIAPDWLEWFEDGRPQPAFMDRVDAVRDSLTEDGRTMVAGALGWIWARSPWAVPIPGFRTAAQVEQIAAARAAGPLAPAQMDAIAQALGSADA